MIFVYNFLQAVLLLITFPFLFLVVAGKKKYRSRIGDRLGIGLGEKIAGLNPGKRKIIWIHSLSVGEVTSALPLVIGIREEMEKVCVVFSASTSTGLNIAQKKIKPYVDSVVAAPLDLLPVVKKFVRVIQPDMFILVETDFWPNWLNSLRQNKIPLVLVNGRISHTSFTRYNRFRFFFLPMFQSFSLLSMQTENDAVQMGRLGIPSKRIKTLGNLKYDTTLFTDNDTEKKTALPNLKIPENTPVWVCGSTHPGEEEMIITAFTGLLRSRKNIFLILAPRDPGRCEEIQKLIAGHGLQSMRRTFPADRAAPILILDNIGELADCYRLAQVAFIGGSLADFGGHNPLEASAHGVPVLFGPHMDDFQEIARDLTECGAALKINSPTNLKDTVHQILDDTTVHQRMSDAARNLVRSNSGVISRHIQELHSLLPKESSRT